MCLISSGIAKPNKKLKVNKPAEDPKAAGPENQTMSESLHQTSEVATDDPPLEEHNVIMDSMDVNPTNAKPLSPTKPVEEKPEDVSDAPNQMCQVSLSYLLSLPCLLLACCIFAMSSCAWHHHVKVQLSLGVFGNY